MNISEADDAVREAMRLNLREVYRTLLGHFRHESGHYYWDLLVRDHPHIDKFRGVFGDERQNYADSLRRHYELGTLENWQEYCVTPYAASHPWEECLRLLRAPRTLPYRMAPRTPPVQPGHARRGVCLVPKVALKLD